MECDPSEIQLLSLASTIGFEGKVPGGLLLHPDGKHYIYPLGSTVVIKEPQTSKQCFLNGHNNNVSCLGVSKSGRYVASGQINHMGFKASVFIWDWEKRAKYGSHEVHKVKVEAVAFSPRDKYLASLGGRDDANVIIYDMCKKEPLCGLTASCGTMGYAHALAYFNQNDDIFISGGDQTLRVWQLDHITRKILPTNAELHKTRRDICCLLVEETDQWCYCGTTSGDILQMRLEVKKNVGRKEAALRSPAPIATPYEISATLMHTLIKHVTKKSTACAQFQKGVRTLRLLSPDQILVGSGDGWVTLVNRMNAPKKKKEPLGSKYKLPTIVGTLQEVKKVEVSGGVTSLTPVVETFVLVGTNQSHVYKLDVTTFELTLTMTCHKGAINDVVFPKGCPDLIATCSYEDIRIWNSQTDTELLRITVPNMECMAITFTKDGTSLLSGWNDGKLRAYTPETGRPIFTINDAHKVGVSAIAVTSNGRRLISGGQKGIVRVWELTPHKQTLLGSLNEHKGTVTCIHIKSSDKECVTSSTDGSCIIWDLERFVRNQIMFSNTLFTGVRYHPMECQVLTCGTDRKVGYWETLDGAMIRELDGSPSHSLNYIDITADGTAFVTGGADKFVRVWRYHEGDITHIGIGHSSDVSKLQISPKSKYIISGSVDGAIFKWTFPEIVTEGRPVPEK